jgi:hypothetical protein
MSNIDLKETSKRSIAWAPHRTDGMARDAGSVIAKARDTLALARIGAFCAASWSAAAVLYFGRHSVALIVLSGVVALGGFDLFRPE